jgi:hypothetical protein
MRVLRGSHSLSHILFGSARGSHSLRDLCAFVGSFFGFRVSCGSNFLLELWASLPYWWVILLGSFHVYLDSM